MGIAFIQRVCCNYGVRNLDTDQETCSVRFPMIKKITFELLYYIWRKNSKQKITGNLAIRYWIIGFKRKPHIFFYNGFSDTFTKNLRFNDFLGLGLLSRRISLLWMKPPLASISETEKSWTPHIFYGSCNEYRQSKVNKNMWGFIWILILLIIDLKYCSGY